MRETVRKAFTRAWLVWLEMLRSKMIFPQAVKEAEDKLYEGIENTMMVAIYGSNFIERAGTDYHTTIDVCKRVFSGEDIEDTNEGEVAARARLEVINHAKAMQHIVNAMVENDESLTEKLILETHAILCNGIPNDDDTPPEEYAGQYRKEDVAVHHKTAQRPHKFIHPAAVPTFMANMCARYEQDVKECERTSKINPFDFASRYSYVFVNIHPFADGNGRMCRLILNAVLLKYAGICVPIGEEGDKSRDQYLDIMHEGSRLFLTEEADDFHNHGHGSLATLVKEKASLRFREIMDRLQI
ncbi:MAG: hypothetical protein Q9220_002442 [cf. Caloplaca sp. 1 TL-2023]